jgi:sugar porter (SP) family MFS transporter
MNHNGDKHGGDDRNHRTYSTIADEDDGSSSSAGSNGGRGSASGGEEGGGGGGGGNNNNNNKRGLVRLVCVAAATAATLGYDVGIMAAAIRPLEERMDLTGVQKEFAMGSLNFVAAFGAVGGGCVADRHGRKRTIAACCWLFVVGTVLMSLAPDYAALLLGRVVTGLGVGVAFVAAPSYITEVAPTDSRGRLNTVFDISINGGILAGYVTGFVVQLLWPGNWRLMLFCGVLLPVVVLGLLSGLPESPRWLMLVDQRVAAEAVLVGQLGNTREEAVRTVRAMEQELAAERRSHPGSHFGPGQRLAVQLGFWQQITGTEAVLYYSADFLARAGLESPTRRLLGNVFVGLCKLVPELLAMRYIDTAGRRPLLLGSACALTAATAALSAAFHFNASPYAVVLLLCGVMAAFSAGLGPFTFLSASENLALSERAVGMTYCAAANRCTSGLVALTAVSLTQLLGDAGLFGLYAFFGLLSLRFYYATVPETAGQSLEDLAARNRGSGEDDEQTTMELPHHLSTDERHMLT